MTAALPTSTAANEIRRDDRAAWLVIALFWLAQYSIVTAVDHIVANVAILFLPRILLSVTGLVLSLLISRLRFMFVGLRAVPRMLSALGLALAGALVQTAITYLIWNALAPEMRPVINLIIYLADTQRWFWIYAALIGIVLALDYGRDLAERERRIAALDRAANEAQLRALRYQLNPHFMFNTLNSIAALVDRKDNETASRMIEDLADFLRVTLATDPTEDISLARELELQSLYLAIEEKRFPDRLTVEIDVSAEAARALVPSLITQPLAENVIRHAVAQTRDRVLLHVVGRKVGEQLHLVVYNSRPDGVPRAGGTSVGLNNVAERLHKRFGAAALFDASAQADGGYAVSITLPFTVAT